ncbi:MAG TPA: transcriptional regulator GcvA [Roseiarcus sp.]|nr:transcriptional regulator GcvA [Roseiarcus sp.]
MKSPARLPSLNALRAFEAVSRRLSYARAADELFVTKAAVAQQVRQLEAEVGATLVERAGRGLRLTEAGQAGVRDLADGFEFLARATRAMREASGRRFLVINSSPSFAATWLVGRIGRFKAAHPDIDVLLDANPLDELEHANVDALIRWGAGDFPGFSTTLLFEENVFPVCAPRLAEGPNALRAPHDLKAHTLLHLDWNPSFSTWPTWADWLKAAGASEVDASRGVWFNHMSMALYAAAQGQGVTLTTLAIAADELAAGRVVAPFTTEVHTPFGYYFLCRPENSGAARIAALRDFLAAEAKKSTE